MMIPLTSIPITYAPQRPSAPRSILKKTSQRFPGLNMDQEAQGDLQVSPFMASVSPDATTTTKSVVFKTPISTTRTIDDTATYAPKAAYIPKPCRRLFGEDEPRQVFPWSRNMKLFSHDLLCSHVAEQQLTTPTLQKTRIPSPAAPIRVMPTMKYTISHQRSSIAEVARGLRYRSLPYSRASGHSKKKVDMVTFEDLGMFCKGEKTDMTAQPSCSYEVMEVDESAMEFGYPLDFDQTMED